MEKIQTIAQLKEAINKLLDYNWDDEKDDFQEHRNDKAHIFVTMQALADWVGE